MKKLLLLNFFIGSLAFAQVTETGVNVGIGTTTPARKLEVTENSSADAVGLRLTNSGWVSHMSTSLEFKTGSQKSVPTSKISSIMNGSGNAGDRLGFFLQENGTNPNNNPLVEKVSILPNGNLGIGVINPSKKLHVNGVIGVGIMSGSNSEGFRIDYVDGGAGTTTFKNNRWGGNIYFKRNSSLGERTQFLFGGTSEHYMNIYDSNNEVKVRFISGGNSYINGGNLGIGTTDTKGFKLGVLGKIAAEEVKIATHGNWADFVFKSNYNLPTLIEVEQYIKEKGHLKDIPSADAVKKDGFFLGDMDSKLLQKIEELTLYTIEQGKEIEFLEKQVSEIKELKEENQLLRKKFDVLEALMSKIIKKQ